MKKALLIALTIALLPCMSFAAKVKEGEALPSVSIKEPGKMTLNGEEITYGPWKSAELTGKVRTVYHLAATSAAKEINAEYIEALKKAKFPIEKYQTVTILNLDDAMFGTGGIVKGKAEDSQKEFKTSGYVLDEEGSARKAWDLAKDGSAVIVIDGEGKVLKFKEGKLTAAEIEDFVNTIKAKIQ